MGRAHRQPSPGDERGAGPPVHAEADARHHAGPGRVRIVVPSAWRGLLWQHHRHRDTEPTGTGGERTASVPNAFGAKAATLMDRIGQAAGAASSVRLR